MGRTVFTNGLVFDGSGTPPAPGEVTLDGDRVVSVTTGWQEDHGADDVIDATACTVMPGLVESLPTSRSRRRSGTSTRRHRLGGRTDR